MTAIALAALGLTGYGAFWIYLFSRRAGMLFSYAAVSACYLAVVYLLVQPSRVRLLPVKQLVMPGILVVLASGFIVSLGLLRGGADAQLEIPPVRFRPPDLVGDHICAPPPMPGSCNTEPTKVTASKSMAPEKFISE